MVDIDSFLKRKGMTKADLCRRLGMDPKSSLLSSYEKGRSDPSYKVCLGLLKLGMTVEELFGIDYNKLHELSKTKEIRLSEEDIRKAALLAKEMMEGDVDNGI